MCDLRADIIDGIFVPWCHASDFRVHFQGLGILCPSPDIRSILFKKINIRSAIAELHYTLEMNASFRDFLSETGQFWPGVTLPFRNFAPFYSHTDRMTFVRFKTSHIKQ